MRDEDNDKFWEIISFMDLCEADLNSIKRSVENVLTNIRHRRSALIDYLLDNEVETKED